MFGVVAFCFSPVGGIVRVLYIRFVLLEGFSGVGGVEPGVEFGYEVFAVAFFGEFDGVGSGVGDGLFGVFVVGGVGGSAYFVGEVEGYFGGEGFAAVVGGEGVVDGVGVYGVCSSESGGGEGEFFGVYDVLVEVGVFFGCCDGECFDEALDDGVGFCGGLDCFAGGVCGLVEVGVASHDG